MTDQPPNPKPVPDLMKNLLDSLKPAELDETILDQLDVFDEPSTDGHSPDDLSDEDALGVPGVAHDDGHDISMQDEPTRPEGGRVPTPPAED